jgi:hypothetical protein
MTKLFFRLAFLVGTAGALHADSTEGYIPLYAGTQLAFFANNAAPGHISVQPFLAYIRGRGVYNSHWTEKPIKIINGVTSLTSLETGITDWLDISLYLNGAYEKRGHQHSWLVGDTSIYLGLQLARDQKDHWTPDLRILLAETFPTGKYDRLDPKKGGSDIFGTGAYITTAVLVIAKTFYTSPKHPYKLNLNLIYLYPSHVAVHGSSLYGGLANTRGTALPDPAFITNVAIEYSFNQNWVLGTDIRYVYQGKATFKGKHDPLIKPGFPFSEQFSLAPCIEYSWSLDFSAAIGPWFTIAGRNSSSFFGIIGNVYCYF